MENANIGILREHANSIKNEISRLEIMCGMLMDQLKLVKFELDRLENNITVDESDSTNERMNKVLDELTSDEPTSKINLMKQVNNLSSTIKTGNRVPLDLDNTNSCGIQITV